jgi:minichromosome maintenance protein 10
MLGAQASQSDSGYDPFSEIHLKRREIPHSVVAREMQGKEVYPLPRLLKEVKSPEYEPPDCECDYVVFAVLASKSNPLDHAASHRTAEKHGADKLEAPKNKFMVLHLTDLKWEIDCYLFGTAFNQFWKLTPGTLLAIMNPAILPPKGNQHSGRFSLKLGSSEDAVMEIGIARDLGYCSAVKKDGQPCGEWIDKRKTEACEFHINLQVEKARKGRMEVNTMWNDGAKKDRPKSRVPQETRSKKGAGAYHREYGQLYSVNTGLGKSAASLLDDDDKKLMDGMTEEEASRKRIAAAQKDRDLARQLGEMGSGIGAEMMRNSKHVKAAAASSSSTTTTTAFASTRSTAEQARDDLFSKRSAAELGLLGKKASAASLEPAKDRRRHFGLGTLALSSSSSSSTRTRTRTANHSSDAMGWGGARTAGLLQPKAPPSTTRPPERSGGQKTRLDELETKRSNLVRPRSEESSVRSSGSQSPTKKKARFALDRGIREPGRESLPGQAEQMELVDSDDDDDDDLDIV